MGNDLRIIKKKYGDEMMHLCRELFPTILEVPGLLSELMISNIAPSRMLYDDLISNGQVNDFKKFIYSKSNIKFSSMVSSDKTPEELMSDIGYNLYMCETNDDIQSFKRYYKKGEELCSFKDKDRLDRNYVFFAVKKNVDEIKREDFLNPERQDEYGTSVISIQFTKDRYNQVSIKNRYNHSVLNCDATFGNNLDNIVLGLNDSFSKKYKFNLSFDCDYDFNIPKYIEAINDDGKLYYRHFFRLNDIYYCENNVLVYPVNDGTGRFKADYRFSDTGRYIRMDNFFLDLKEKVVLSDVNDSFVDAFIDVDKISVIRLLNGKKKIIKVNYLCGKKAVIEIDCDGNIISYFNDFIEEINDDFMEKNVMLLVLDIPNVKKIGNRCLVNNDRITVIIGDKVTVIGNQFLLAAKCLEVLSFRGLVKVGDDFLFGCVNLKKLNVPKLRFVGDNFLFENNILVFEKIYYRVITKLVCYSNELSHNFHNLLSDEVSGVKKLVRTRK